MSDINLESIRKKPSGTGLQSFYPSKYNATQNIMKMTKACLGIQGNNFSSNGVDYNSSGGEETYNIINAPSTTGFKQNYVDKGSSSTPFQR